MANEITVTGSLTFAKGNVATNGLTRSGQQFNVSGTNYTRKTQNIGTSAEVLALGEIGTAGWFLIYNMDATNYVEVLDSTGGNVCLKIKPGEFACGRFGAAAPALKANTAAVNVDYIVVED
jgi:hypothetical protein